MKITTSIIPNQPTLAKVHGGHELNLEAICVFTAIGFFLDQDTYWNDEVVLQPASVHTINDDNVLLKSESRFKWHYSPRNITFKQALNEYADLFERIINEQTNDKKVILPLSGGIDSRTQAVALKRLKADVFSYSYEFENGYNETKIAKQIADACGFKFQDYKIKAGYLWEVLDELSELNHCFSDFTSPRQMGISNAFSSMGDVFSLGHWGDVLFDSMNLPQLSHEEAIDVLMKKLLKKGGLEFAESLWQAWHLQGNFKDYFKNRIETLLNTIEIEDTNAKLRAFKSKYWAPRWTSINLSVFKKSKPISLPYFDDRMCEFICGVPEAYLKNRQLQIAYIKDRSPELTKIKWQDQRPFNLNNFQLNKWPYNMPYRVLNKLQREIKSVLGNNYVQRNWELQFLGENNKNQLNKHVLNNDLETWIPKPFIERYLDAFNNGNTLNNAHPVNMLLVLSKFNQRATNG